eukprot:CAMPEP_0197048010 /NCGR_PEP_ID=MMETSP1384-20130603/23412_1 /TAXON_ID=29189 /ORGANISM="Ammonia sp." /LENGTH=535 /DNA_ID=CAMNT_0042480053 /DNA_START=144 /DNA_END=1751 /DNA_ORIENTATION=-
MNNEETKPLQNTDEVKPAKPLPRKQMQQRRRYPPRAPGFFPVPADIVVTMSLQLGLVVTNFIVIVTSFAYDGEGLGLIITLEILFTYIGFAFFIRKISHQILVYKRFFMKLNDWYSTRYDALSTDNGCLCCCFKFVLLNVCWWVVALLMYPLIIGWSMKQSYNWYQDRRRNAHSAVDLTQRENVTHSLEDARQYLKMTDNAYSVWHLGVLAKQASMVVLFVQDIPLLALSFVLGNYVGIVVYLVAVVLKLLFWFKHMYDLGTCTLFYNAEHYLDHFGIKSIEWSLEMGCDIIVATFYSPEEHEMSTLQVGDWVALYDEQSREWAPMIVLQSRHFKKTDNLVLVDYLKVDKQAIDDYEKGKTKKIVVPPELIRVVNRWDGNVELLRDDDYEEYHDKYVYGENGHGAVHEEQEEKVNVGGDGDGEERKVDNTEVAAVEVVVVQVVDTEEVANNQTEARNVSVAGNGSGSVSASDVRKDVNAEIAEDDTKDKKSDHADDDALAAVAEKNADKVEDDAEDESGENDGLLQDAVVVNQDQ